MEGTLVGSSIKCLDYPLNFQSSNQTKRWEFQNYFKLVFINLGLWFLFSFIIDVTYYILTYGQNSSPNFILSAQGNAIFSSVVHGSFSSILLLLLVLKPKMVSYCCLDCNLYHYQVFFGSEFGLDRKKRMFWIYFGSNSSLGNSIGIIR